MSSDTRTLTARWVFPACSPPLERGTVTVRGETIVAVEPHAVRSADEDLGNVAIIPGLVNAHTHLDLSGARGLIPPTDPEHFTDWLKAVIAFRRTRTEEQTLADIEAGLGECLQFGTTLIGDIASEGRSWDALSAAKTRAVVYWELIGLNAERLSDAWQHAGYVSGMSWEETPPGVVVKLRTPTCRWGISPHAPYSVHSETARIMLTIGVQAATHVAESPSERTLLELREGPFTRFLSELGVYQPDSLSRDWNCFLEPLPFTLSRPTSPTVVVHGNYLSPNFSFRPNHFICYCPRTHAAFGHPPHPFRDFLARGVRVCLGTDSLASNPDLDILAEARFVHAKYPDFPGEQLLKMVTLSGAEALGWADECGSLEPGKSADLVAVPLPDADGDPHRLLFADTPGGRRTMWRGRWR
ncbi:MAG: amidohydrolase family protein [Fimbriiglobus sp.]|jgi:cytosine/adenosine deaminase-related metal-dependent hydrolase|nr:amidohydrolase family protein [Fimbriiglobus sp.]